ncbi:group-specific protein [Rossellomorea vietnamensis]|uniref:group-specific protein n=1 Tax=Rossellomorea vietnamensis TaxID=218284 RepID=UPI000559437E|nr:group-specific protein [Rossellomorea vietnamensis]
MINIDINEEAARELYLQKLEERIKEVDVELVYWDSRELKRRTCLSWNTIQKEFFYHPDFPKYKIGHKWMFPAQDTKKFLLQYLRENVG